MTVFTTLTENSCTEFQDFRNRKFSTEMEINNFLKLTKSASFCN